MQHYLKCYEDKLKENLQALFSLVTTDVDAKNLTTDKRNKTNKSSSGDDGIRENVIENA